MSSIAKVLSAGAATASVLAALSTGTYAQTHHPQHGNGAPAAPSASSAPRVSFALRVDRGNGPEHPRADYSTATVRVEPVLEGNVPAFRLNVRARFYLLDGETHDLRCWINVRPGRQVLEGQGLRCRDRSTMLDLGHPEGVEVAELTDSRLVLRIARIRMVSSNLTFLDVVFRLDDPSGQLLTPPRAFQP